MTDPNRWWPRREDLTAMARLSIPVVAIQLGIMAMGVVDSMVVGRVSATALAAVALGNMYFLSVCAFAMGTLLALDPLVAQALGAGDAPAVVRAVQRGLLLALALSLPTALALGPGEAVLNLLGQPEDVVPVAAAYARICIPGVPAMLGFIVLRQTLQAMQRVAPIVVIIVAANLVNLVLDLALVYGKLGAPALGALGSAWASTSCRWLLAAGLLITARRHLAPLLSRREPALLELGPLLGMLRVGLPIGAQHQLEFAIFGVIALLTGWLGTAAVAAHQVAISLAASTFMVPLGVSAAAAVLVGRAVGRGDAGGTRRAAVAGLLCGSGFMILAAALFLAVPGALARSFSDVPEVLRIAVALIPVAGFFQVFDGLQVVSTGILRGLGDTIAPLVVNLVGFWCIGLPVSLLLGFGAGRGAVGLWWGLVAGLGAVGVFLGARVWTRLRAEVVRLVIDEPGPMAVEPWV